MPPSSANAFERHWVIWSNLSPQEITICNAICHALHHTYWEDILCGGVWILKAGTNICMWNTSTQIKGNIISVQSNPFYRLTPVSKPVNKRLVKLFLLLPLSPWVTLIHVALFWAKFLLVKHARPPPPPISPQPPWPPTPPPSPQTPDPHP